MTINLDRIFLALIIGAASGSSAVGLMVFLFGFGISIKFHPKKEDE